MMKMDLFFQSQELEAQEVPGGQEDSGGGNWEVLEALGGSRKGQNRSKTVKNG